MTSIAAPATRRAYQNIPPINKASNDYHCANGTRVCLPCYLDVPNSIRKNFLNSVRELASQPIEASKQPDSLTDIKVMTYSTLQPDIEAYLGMSLDNLRNCLFSRGGLEVSLILKLEEITGIVVVTDKDLTAAFKKKQSQVKGFKKTYPLNATAE